MKKCSEIIAGLRAGDFDRSLRSLYPQSSAANARGRIISAAEEFIRLYGDRPARLVSAPGRTEICGNHTDHQRGRVLAAAIDLDTLCIASPNDDGVVRIKSEGYEPDEVRLSGLEPLKAETGRSAALIRGVAAWLSRRGYNIGGFDAYTVTDVLSGSGLSSSAAFEIVVGNAFKALYPSGITPVELALAGQYAENVHFGKPCGLMDQMASSLGGTNLIDFKDPASPEITAISCEISELGYKLCIVDTGGSHADLTAEYASIPEDMRNVARYYGKTVLREVDEAEFISDIPKLRDVAGDRAVLRAMHYFSDDARTALEASALSKNDIDAFLALVKQSGASSLLCLQNVFAPGETRYQRLPLALALCERALGSLGAWRVHGGGFAGTIQAFVPNSLIDKYRGEMDAVFGANACKILSIRPAGGCVIGED